MSLKITWNRLYFNQPRARAFAKRRIRYHYFFKGLRSRGFRSASVRFVFYFYFLFVLVECTGIIFGRPTGWHGESGAAQSGGHLTVLFYSRVGAVTHHVYRCNEAYCNFF